MALRAEAIEQASERARREPAFARVLAELVDVPIALEREYRHAAAVALNRQRLAQAEEAFKKGALVTSQVQQFLGYKSPQAVHRLRSRGKLLGVQLGNATWFPEWQFKEGRLRPDLPRIIELLTDFSADVIAYDRVMRLRHAELGGRCIADALDRPKYVSTAWNILADLGGGF
jgi:hypothetical protein